ALPLREDGKGGAADRSDALCACTHPNTTARCDEENPSTLDDVCTDGMCAGTPIVCDDGQFCDGEEACVDGTCQTVVPAPTCDDAMACTTDSCDPAAADGHGECVHEDVPGCCRSNADCDDGNLCNGIEMCRTATGLCQRGRPVGCGDGRACTHDS